MKFSITRRLAAYIVLSSLFLLTGCQSSTSSGKEVTLNEVAHSVFYAPQYVAIELGYFKEEGINLKLVTGFGADKTMTALVSKEADIGFMGSEASIYLYAEGANDYAVNFAQLTQRAGNFLVSRTPIDNFSWEQVNGKEIIGGRKGGMPQMLLEYILKQHQIDPSKDVSLVQNIDFANTSGAFIGGTGDFTVEFEPSATLIEQQHAGYVVASLGVESGFVPYTAYCALESYINENPETIAAFTRAIQKGLDYVNAHSADEIATVIAPQFPELDQDTLSIIIERYQAQETWNDDLIFREDSFELLQTILMQSGELSTNVPYDQLVSTRFADDAKK